MGGLISDLLPLLHIHRGPPRPQPEPSSTATYGAGGADEDVTSPTSIVPTTQTTSDPKNHRDQEGESGVTKSDDTGKKRRSAVTGFMISAMMLGRNNFFLYRNQSNLRWQMYNHLTILVKSIPRVTINIPIGFGINKSAQDLMDRIGYVGFLYAMRSLLVYAFGYYHIKDKIFGFPIADIMTIEMDTMIHNIPYMQDALQGLIQMPMDIINKFIIMVKDFTVTMIKEFFMDIWNSIYGTATDQLQKVTNELGQTVSNFITGQVPGGEALLELMKKLQIVQTLPLKDIQPLVDQFSIVMKELGVSQTYIDGTAQEFNDILEIAKKCEKPGQSQDIQVLSEGDVSDSLSCTEGIFKVQYAMVRELSIVLNARYYNKWPDKYLLFVNNDLRRIKHANTLGQMANVVYLASTEKIVRKTLVLNVKEMIALRGSSKQTLVADDIESSTQRKLTEFSGQSAENAALLHKQYDEKDQDDPLRPDRTTLLSSTETLQTLTPMWGHFESRSGTALVPPLGGRMYDENDHSLQEIQEIQEIMQNVQNYFNVEIQIPIPMLQTYESSVRVGSKTKTLVHYYVAKSESLRAHELLDELNEWNVLGYGGNPPHYRSKVDIAKLRNKSVDTAMGRGVRWCIDPEDLMEAMAQLPNTALSYTDTSGKINLKCNLRKFVARDGIEKLNNTNEMVQKYGKFVNIILSKWMKEWNAMKTFNNDGHNQRSWHSGHTSADFVWYVLRNEEGVEAVVPLLRHDPNLTNPMELEKRTISKIDYKNRSTGYNGTETIDYTRETHMSNVVDNPPKEIRMINFS